MILGNVPKGKLRSSTPLLCYSLIIIPMCYVIIFEYALAAFSVIFAYAKKRKVLIMGSSMVLIIFCRGIQREDWLPSDFLLDLTCFLGNDTLCLSILSHGASASLWLGIMTKDFQYAKALLSLWDCHLLFLLLENTRSKHSKLAPKRCSDKNGAHYRQCHLVWLCQLEAVCAQIISFSLCVSHVEF